MVSAQSLVACTLLLSFLLCLSAMAEVARDPVDQDVIAAARALFLEKKDDDAIVMVQEAVDSLRRPPVEYYTLLAYFHYDTDHCRRLQDRYERCIASLEEISRIVQEASDAGVFHPDLDYYQGKSAMIRMNLDDAVIYFRDALKANPDHLGAIVNLAIVQAQRGNQPKHAREASQLFKEAETLMEKAIKIRPVSLDDYESMIAIFMFRKQTEHVHMWAKFTLNKFPERKYVIDLLLNSYTNELANWESGKPNEHPDL
eukprot:TRINITY_DN7000_c0_g1_i1.p1 TRINITY_DN7000_c0_g1~~TRINITY_DN7000_c0_g1_i1.p1  ORF type:complete len:257 (-),score=57.42 TRINITY_DN7000_c0_g1_i1:68-838(-)